MILGVHVSGAQKVYETVDIAQDLGCNTMQFFARSPQRWREGFLSSFDIEEFRKRREKARLKPVFIHISYLINLASPNAKLYNVSIEAYIEDMLEAHALGADYIVTHMGSHKETSEQQGIKRFIDAINEILGKTRHTKVGILLENTSGSGSWLGYKFSHHMQIIEGIKDKERVGLCLDTAHAYLAGYDLSVRDGLEFMVDEIDKLVGAKLIKLIHLNDAKGKLGSKHDRHDHIGKGGIGMSGMKRIINHPKLKDLPFILETPKETIDSDRVNLSVIRKLRN